MPMIPIFAGGGLPDILTNRRFSLSDGEPNILARAHNAIPYNKNVTLNLGGRPADGG